MGKTALFFYRRAIELAKIAENMGEVPVGAVLVLDENIIGEGYNSPIYMNDPASHAEIMAMRAAAKTSGNYRLLNTTLYVTLEPCIMCYAAAVHARVRKICYSASDQKGGIFSTGAYEKIKKIFNHEIEMESGILEGEASGLLKKFFQKRR